MNDMERVWLFEVRFRRRFFRPVADDEHAKWNRERFVEKDIEDVERTRQKRKDKRETTGPPFKKVMSLFLLLHSSKKHLLRHAFRSRLAFALPCMHADARAQGG